MVPDDGANSVCACGVLLARCDDEAAWFEQERESGHSRRQVVVCVVGYVRRCVAP